MAGTIRGEIHLYFLYKRERAFLLFQSRGKKREISLWTIEGRGGREGEDKEEASRGSCQAMQEKEEMYFRENLYSKGKKEKERGGETSVSMRQISSS